jgi:hypothetical protein
VSQDLGTQASFESAANRFDLGSPGLAFLAPDISPEFVIRVNPRSIRGPTPHHFPPVFCIDCAHCALFIFALSRLYATLIQVVRRIFRVSPIRSVSVAGHHTQPSDSLPASASTRIRVIRFFRGSSCSSGQRWPFPPHVGPHVGPLKISLFPRNLHVGPFSSIFGEADPIGGIAQCQIGWLGLNRKGNPGEGRQRLR